MMIHLVMLKTADAGRVKKVCEHDYNARKVNDLG
jgi:hypothetical protein